MSYRNSSDAVVALFSGAGGLSLGFSHAGVGPRLAAEIDGDACETYRKNLNADVWNVDLSSNNEQLSAALSSIARPFALIGGPPCQGFSSAGLKSRDDPRNRLIFSYLSTLERLRPRWFLFENVEGLLTSNGGVSLSSLVVQLIRLGYRLRVEKVNFAGFGLPQARKRVIIVGNSLGVDFSFPRCAYSFNAGKHRSASGLPLAPSVSEALAGLGNVVSRKDLTSEYASKKPANDYDEMMRQGNKSCSVSLHFAQTMKGYKEIIRQLKPGQTMKDLPERFWHESYRRRAFRRVMDGTPTEQRGGAPSGIKRLNAHFNSLTITSAATREFVHPSFDRTLTLREVARLQSFPDVFEFVGNSSSVAKQIGNAFPPLAARVFAAHLMALDGQHGAGRKKIRSKGAGALIGYSLTEAIGMSPALQKTYRALELIAEKCSQLELEMGEMESVA